MRATTPWMMVAFLCNALLLGGGCVAGAPGAEEGAGPNENIAEAESELSYSNAEYVAAGCTNSGGTGKINFAFWRWEYVAACLTEPYSAAYYGMATRCTEAGGTMYEWWYTEDVPFQLGYTCHDF